MKWTQALALLPLLLAGSVLAADRPVSTQVERIRHESREVDRSRSGRPDRQGDRGSSRPESVQKDEGKGQGEDPAAQRPWTTAGFKLEEALAFDFGQAFEEDALRRRLELTDPAVLKQFLTRAKFVVKFDQSPAAIRTASWVVDVCRKAPAGQAGPQGQTAGAGPAPTSPETRNPSQPASTPSTSPSAQAPRSDSTPPSAPSTSPSPGPSPVGVTPATTQSAPVAPRPQQPTQPQVRPTGFPTLTDPHEPIVGKTVDPTSHPDPRIRPVSTKGRRSTLVRQVSPNQVRNEVEPQAQPKVLTRQAQPVLQKRAAVKSTAVPTAPSTTPAPVRVVPRFQVLEYFPTDPSYRWDFVDQGTGELFHRRIVGTEERQGLTCHLVQRSRPGTDHDRELISVGAQGLLLHQMRVQGGELGLQTPVFLSAREIRIGSTHTTASHPVGLAPGGQASWTVTVVGIETVTVPAGRFEHCARLHVVVRNGQGPRSEFDLWYAKGCGLVKRTGKVCGRSVNEEMVRHNLPGPWVPASN